MSDALVQINDRVAEAARVRDVPAARFHCECGHCLAEDVRLSIDEHEEIRAREDLIFAPGHDAPRRYRVPQPAGSASQLGRLDFAELRLARLQRR